MEIRREREKAANTMVQDTKTGSALHMARHVMDRVTPTILGSLQDHVETEAGPDIAKGSKAVHEIGFMSASLVIGLIKVVGSKCSVGLVGV